MKPTIKIAITFVCLVSLAVVKQARGDTESYPSREMHRPSAARLHEEAPLQVAVRELKSEIEILKAGAEAGRKSFTLGGMLELSQLENALAPIQPHHMRSNAAEAGAVTMKLLTHTQTLINTLPPAMQKLVLEAQKRIRYVPGKMSSEENELMKQIKYTQAVISTLTDEDNPE